MKKTKHEGSYEDWVTLENVKNVPGGRYAGGQTQHGKNKAQTLMEEHHQTNFRRKIHQRGE